MPATIDTAKAHLTRRHGDLYAVYTWVNDQRALVLIPAERPGAPWFIIMEPEAWRYDDPHQLKASAMKACEVLGMEPSRPNWFRVAKIIHDGLPDLVLMPSAPDPEKLAGTYGQVVVREDGVEVGGEELKLDKETGVTYG
jgi:hypothetical protein